MAIFLLFIVSFSVFANESGEYLGYEEAQSFVQTIGIKNKREYLELLTEGKEMGLPPIKDLPNVYPKYWQGWGEFLGEPDDSRSKRVKQLAKEELREEEIVPEEEIVSEEGLSLKTELKVEELFQEEELRVQTESEKKEGLTVEEVFPLSERIEDLDDKITSLEAKINQIRTENEEKLMQITNEEEVIAEEKLEIGFEDQKNHPIKKSRVPRKKQSNPVGVKFLSYKELQLEVKKHAIRNAIDYHTRYKEILRAPSNPDKVYKKKGEWKGWSDLLGTKEKIFLSYEELHSKVREYSILNSEQYKREYKKILGAPSRPDQFYKKKGEWKGWIDLLGIEDKVFLSYEKLQLEVKKNSIRNFKDYRMHYRKILGAPSHPDQFYKTTGEWKGWPDLLGNEAKVFLSYENLQLEVKKHSILSVQDYWMRYKEISGAHSRPDRFYKRTGKWTRWSDLLGTEEKVFLSYKELQSEVKKYSILSSQDYRTRYKEILGAPSNPEQFYKKTGEWKGWYDFLGNKEKIFLSYKKLRSNVEEHSIFSSKEYMERYKEILGAPSRPDQFYKETGEWKGWPDLLSKNKCKEVFSKL